jgi:hypothetical protein
MPYPRRLPISKCLAARSPSSTAPETAETATILIRFCVAIDSIDDASASGGLAFDGWRFFFGVVFFAGMVFPGRWRVRPRCSLTLTLPCRGLPSICGHHGMLSGEKA